MLSRDDGSSRAPILVIGEAYGHWEEVYERPLVGPTYNDKLKPWLTDVGLSREDLYITNTWDQGQPASIGGIPEFEMRASMDRLHDRIAAHEGPDGNGPMVIVPLGNYALYAVTGNGVVSFHTHDGRWKRPGIQDWRGSILEYQDRRGRRIKVIPSVHPAATFPFRQPGLEWVCRADWKRIAEDAKFRELRLPPRTYMIAPSAAEAIEWMRWTRAEAEKVKGGAVYFERLACSLDVETPNKVEYELRQKESTAVTAKCQTCGHTKKWHPGAGFVEPLPACTGPRAKGCGLACTGFAPPLLKPKRVKIAEYPYLGCIGYSWDPKISLTIPTTLEYWQDPAVWARVKAEMAAFHADPNVDFGGQNFGFDAWWCAVEGLPLATMAWDLMKMHRVRVPFSEWHDLAFQGSLYVRQAFWKHESKLPDEISRWSHNKEQLWRYNGIDNCVQRSLLPLHVEALKAGGRLEYYNAMEAPIDPGLLELSLHGIRADEPGREVHFEKVMVEAKSLSAELNAAAGMPIVTTTKKGVITGKVPSNAKLKTFLYEVLRLPMQYVKNAKKQKVVSTNVVTVKRLMEQFPGIEQLQTVGKMVLRHRRLNTEAQNVKAERLTNGRQYATFRQDTVLGRLSSSKTPRGDGANLQNVDRKLRRFYLPDTGDEAV